MQFYSRRTAPVALAVLAIACSSSVFAAPPAKSGLTTDKDKVSYAIGVQIGTQVGKSFDQIKGEVDPTIVAHAITTILTGGKALMTDDEMKTVLADFGKRMQAKQLAEQQAAGMKNLTESTAFLTANKTKPGVVTTASGLQYKVLKAGTGPKPKATDSVKVNYIGQTLDGKTFDSSADHGGPAIMALNSVIPGWTEGVQLMPVGSKFEFWIPALLAYGSKGSGPIGPDATLHFQVELLSIGNK